MTILEQQTDIVSYEIPDDYQLLTQEVKSKFPGVRVVNLDSLEADYEEDVGSWYAENSRKLPALNFIRKLIEVSVISRNPEEAAKARYLIEYATADKLLELKSNFESPDYMWSYIRSLVTPMERWVDQGIGFNGRTEAELEMKFNRVDFTDIKAMDPDTLREVLGDSVNYDYWSPILSGSMFNVITCDIDPTELRVVDVGAGSGNLVRFLERVVGVKPENLMAIDISESSRDLNADYSTSPKRRSSLQGRLETFGIQNSIDLLFLSYFIDRDSNQRATFEGALDAVSIGGMIVFEGLLPALPTDPSGVKYSSGTGQITTGESVVSDLEQIVDGFRVIASEKGYIFKLDQIAIGYRYVYSRDGFERLPSYFITGRKF